MTWEIIGTAVGVVATILGGVWFIINRAFDFGKISRKIEEMDKRTEHASCETNIREINTLKDDMKELSDNVIAIKSLLLVKHKEASSMFSVKNSPRRLNENGQRLYEDIHGDEFLKKNRDFLFSKIDEMEPHTALDVENAAYAACTAHTDSEIFNELKLFVYNSPTYTLKEDDGNSRKYDITLPDVCFVLSLPLRDMYLKNHPEIER